MTLSVIVVPGSLENLREDPQLWRAPGPSSGGAIPSAEAGLSRMMTGTRVCSIF